MYDRSLADPKPISRPKSRLLYKIQTLVGVTGWRMARYRAPWRKVVWACVDLVWRPHIFSILVFEVRTIFELRNGPGQRRFLT